MRELKPVFAFVLMMLGLALHLYMYQWEWLRGYGIYITDESLHQVESVIFVIWWIAAYFIFEIRWVKSFLMMGIGLYIWNAVREYWFNPHAIDISDYYGAVIGLVLTVAEATGKLDFLGNILNKKNGAS